MKYLNTFCVTMVLALLCAASAVAADFRIAARSVDITPNKPIMLQGQMYTRISTKVETPITANVLVMKSCDKDRTLDSAVIISFDLCSIPPLFNETLRNAIAKLVPELDANSKIILSATHTHTSFVLSEGGYVTDDKTIMTPTESIAFIVDRVAPVVADLWKNTVKAKYSYGLGHALIAYNRRAVYENGQGVMYGATDTPKFRSIEGMEDHDVNQLFFWDEKDKLLAMIINVSCPSQEVEGRRAVNADYWHPVRQKLNATYGKDVCILGLCGAAGDMSPRPLYQKSATNRMVSLRHTDRLGEIARRIVRAVDETYPVVQSEKTDKIAFAHRFAILDLPQQKVPKELYESFKIQADEYRKKAEAAKDKGASGPYTTGNWTRRVVTRYEAQQGVAKPTYPIAVHVLRIGDIALCTSPFELYTDFGVQIKARSKATQTFVVQLTDNRKVAGYLPSEQAQKHGGYGAIPQSNHIGAPGGKVLVEETLKMLNPLF